MDIDGEYKECYFNNILGIICKRNQIGGITLTFKVNDKVTWVGIKDWHLRDFHGDELDIGESKLVFV